MVLYTCFLGGFDGSADMLLIVLTAVCMYKGVSFKQGESWKDGCDLVCICENGTTGFYRCDDR